MSGNHKRSHTFRQAALLWIILLILACGPSETDQYQQNMNRVMQRHWDAYGRLTTEVDTLYSTLMSGQSSTLKRQSALASLRDMQGYFEVAESDLANIADDWVRLVPPSKANRFHQLTFEMMQLRIKAVQRSRLALADLFATGTFDSHSAAETASFYDESDRVWLKVLAESKKLGGAEITR